MAAVLGLTQLQLNDQNSRSGKSLTNYQTYAKIVLNCFVYFFVIENLKNGMIINRNIEIPLLMISNEWKKIPQENLFTPHWFIQVARFEIHLRCE